MTRGSVELMPAGADMFASGADALVNPVDCTGAQGKGLALAFRQRFPEACAAYKAWCREGLAWAGRCWWEYVPNSKWIAFVATKDHWRSPSRIEWIKNGLEEIEHFVVLHRSEHTIRSIGLPAIGCGLGGLAWDDVRPLLLEAGERMAAAGVRVMVYEPWEKRRKR